MYKVLYLDTLFQSNNDTDVIVHEALTRLAQASSITVTITVILTITITTAVVVKGI